MFYLFSRYLFLFALLVFFGGFSNLFAQDSDGPYKLLQTGYIDNSSPYTEETIDGDEYVSGDFYVFDDDYDGGYPIDALHPSSYIRKFSDNGQYALWDFYVLKKNAKGKYEKIFAMKPPEYDAPIIREPTWSASISGDAKYTMLINQPREHYVDLITIYKRNDDDTFELFQQFEVFRGDKKTDCFDDLDEGDKRKRSAMNRDGSIITVICTSHTGSGFFIKGSDGKFNKQLQPLSGVKKNPEWVTYSVSIDATPDFNFIATHDLELKNRNTRNYYYKVDPNGYREFTTLFKKTDTGYEPYYTFEEISLNRSYFPNSFISSNADTVILSDDTIWRRKTKQSSKFGDNDPSYEKIQSLGQGNHLRSFSISADGSVIAALINEDPEFYAHEGLGSQPTWGKTDYPSYAFIWQRGDDGLYKKVQSIDLGKKYPSASMTPDAKTISLSGKIFVRK